MLLQSLGFNAITWKLKCSATKGYKESCERNVRDHVPFLYLVTIMATTKALISATIMAPITPPTTADIFGSGSGPESAGTVLVVVLISKSRRKKTFVLKKM